MKFPHTIKYQDHETWQEWVSKHIGVLNIDYFQVAEKYFIEYEDGGSQEGYNAFWEIPDPKKALLWALRWT
jgi:hypothetical protein